MKIELWVVGKTSESWLEKGVEVYVRRLQNYLPFSMQVITESKTKAANPALMVREESKSLLQKIAPEDYVVLLDEQGKQFTSTVFANWLEKKLASSSRRMVFIVGGAYGFSPAVYARADHLLSLSDMTFSHQMIRLFFTEQLYRAMTILRNEPYHNEGRISGD